MSPHDWPGDPVPGRRPGDLPDPMPGDLLGDITSTEPGLDVLLGVLASDPAPDEMHGADAALAMFRASRPPTIPVPGPQPPEPRGPGPRGPGPHASSPHAPGPRAGGRPSRWARHPAVRLAAAVTLAAAAGFAAAAYTQALPDPIQHAAYQVLGFAGVPDTSHPALSAAGLHPSRHRRAHGRGSNPAGGPQPSAAPSSRPGVSASATPPAAGQAVLSVTAASGRITAGGHDTFTGSLTDQGHPVAGVNLSLLERAAGQPSWRLIGFATTSASGQAVVTALDLARNALFRLTGPDGELSQPVLVIVVPTVSASVTPGPAGRADVLTGSSPLASPGNTVVLQVWTGTRWRSVQAGNLNGSGQVSFAVRAPLRPLLYRMVLLATAEHALSVSNPVTVPAR